MRKITVVVCGLILLGFVGTCVYFVGGVSATYPPIKKYQYEGSVSQFEKTLQHYVSLHSNLKCEFSRRDSSQSDDGSRDLTIEVTRNGTAIEYGLVCDNNNDKIATAELKLIEAYNKTANTGGYSAKAEGINKLVSYLEDDLLNKFCQDEHVVINPKKEGFFEHLHIY